MIQCAVTIAWTLMSMGDAATAQRAPRFVMTYPASAYPGPLTGRLILVLAKKAEPEPRLTISLRGPAVFGVFVDQLRAGQQAVIDERSSVGYPSRLADLVPGEYYAQAIVNVYTRVHRADGHIISVPVNDGTEEWFNIAAGNLYSDVQRITVGQGGTVRLSISHAIPPTQLPANSEWVQHLKIQSQALTRFWGRPTFIHATVLLPKGYADHPNVRYPSVYTMGHGVPFFFTTDSSPKPRQAEDRARTGLESGHEFYRSWTSDRFPRVIGISLDNQTPYFLGSYSVNSANNGPYGDATVDEIIPYLEEHFRIIREPYARLIEGASTGGWEALALQLQHPDLFGGAWVLQPDPIDFRHYQMVNIYKDENAFSVPTGPFTTSERPMLRSVEGQVTSTVRQVSLFEEVLGTHGRSGCQLEAWEAVYGPVGPDGYPVPLWDKITGKIDHAVADYMRDHGYDLRDYAQRNWPTLGPKIAGKLHFFAGDMDNYHLNLAVYDFQDFLRQTTSPHYEAQFTYGRPLKGHSWHAFTWSELVLQLADYIKQRAPAGQDIASWTY
ncbi:MAG: alpha/beta hydrolase-fold protein [Gemmatimonadaceae bacterium]